MKKALREVLELVRMGRPAQLSLKAGEKEYLRRFQPRERLVLLGGGHIALQLCPLAAALGFSLTVVDDRPEYANRERFPQADEVLCQSFPEAMESLALGSGDYVAIMTRGHRSDGECLRTILSQRELPFYMGMVASRSRGADLKGQLLGEGFDAGALERLHTPIGLNIHARTLPEIAVSIAAELVAVRRSDASHCGDGSLLNQSEPELSLLEYAVEDSTPKVLLVVLETRGSTPVKTGAMLVTDRSSRIVGSIGGGWGEWECTRKAVDLIGTGAQLVFPVSMDGKDVHGQDMSCGGEMLVLAADLG